MYKESQCRQSALKVIESKEHPLCFQFWTPSDWVWFAEDMSPRFYWAVHFGATGLTDTGALSSGRGQLPRLVDGPRNVGVWDYFSYSVYYNPTVVQIQYTMRPLSSGAGGESGVEICVKQHAIDHAAERKDVDTGTAVVRIGMNVADAPWNSTLAWCRVER